MFTRGSSLKKRTSPALSKKYGAFHIRIFGSVARHAADEKSDIDFLVELEPGRTLFDLGGLAYDLEKLLGRPVDVCTLPFACGSRSGQELLLKRSPYERRQAAAGHRTNSTSSISSNSRSPVRNGIFCAGNSITDTIDRGEAFACTCRFSSHGGAQTIIFIRR